MNACALRLIAALLAMLAIPLLGTAAYGSPEPSPVVSVEASPVATLEPSPVASLEPLGPPGVEPSPSLSSEPSPEPSATPDTSPSPVPASPSPFTSSCASLSSAEAQTGCTYLADSQLTALLWFLGLGLFLNLATFVVTFTRPWTW